MRTGQCYCGAVRYELHGELGPLVNCHCKFCRRASGAAFATSAVIHREDLHLTSGEDDVADFENPEGVRSFCRRCGGRLWNRGLSSGVWVLLVSTLDQEPDTPPVLHVNVESKAPWYEIKDDAPQLPGLPPGFEKSGE